ncbi:MAG: hypothetical protein GKR96_14915 [Gammaproteobacteria bacterium]|nr:hypothetical protein [Gammaproteobacteria bacterium]
MALLDAIEHCDGHAANFLDLPPDSKVNRVRTALELVLADPNVKTLLINVFGGGIMRCDTISDAILMMNSTSPLNKPLVVNLSGTNANLANRRLKESMPQIRLAANLPEAASLAVEIANQSIDHSRKDDKNTSWLSRFSRRF